mgnify:FL=1
MKKIFYLLIIYLLLTDCNVKKKIDHHGVHLLEKKNKLLIINQSNKNDILKLLGPPSVQSSFDNDLLFYIERKITSGNLINLGGKKLLVNNVLVVELDDRGMLVKNEFYDLKKMNDIKIVKKVTEVDYQKTSFIYDFLSSMRQKVNDPLGKRNRK